MVRAVLVEEEVVELDGTQLPEMGEHPVDLGGRQGEFVFPDVAVLDVVVLRDLRVVRHRREGTDVAAGQPAGGVEQRVRAVGARREVHGVREQAGARAAIGRIDAQQRVAVRRRRTVQVGTREHERHAAGVERAAPVVEAHAGPARQPRRIEVEPRIQPREACAETALRILRAVGLGLVREERRELGLEFGRGVGLAARRREEIGAVGQRARREESETRVVVEHRAPLRIVGEAQRAGLRDQGAEGLRGGRIHRQRGERGGGLRTRRVGRRRGDGAAGHGEREDGRTRETAEEAE